MNFFIIGRNERLDRLGVIRMDLQSKISPMNHLAAVCMVNIGTNVLEQTLCAV